MICAGRKGTQAFVFNVSAATPLRPVVDFEPTRRALERAPDGSLLQPDRVTLSSEARRELRRVERTDDSGEPRRREPGAEEDQGAQGRGASARPAERLSKEQQEKVVELRRRDAHVRQHEAAHQAAGAGVTGPASYSYQVGPDGRSYVVGGEVPVRARTGRTPDETIAIARQVRAAALAPADPSPADLAAASAATQVELQAQQQKRKQPGNAAASGRAGGAALRRTGAEQPAPAPVASLERLIVRAPEPEPFL